MKSTMLLTTILSLLLSAVAPVLAQASQIEQAQRHFDRGMAAVEMANSPEDYALAITEFEQAISLAPNWPEAYYNLGMVQEKAGKYRVAAESFRQYLQLAPDSPDAAAVRSLANKAEFKAEQVITDEDVLDIFGSLGDSNIWQRKGVPADDPATTGDFREMQILGRNGQQILVSYVSKYYLDKNDRQNLIRTIRVTPQGKSLSFTTQYLLCDYSTQKDECPDVSDYRLEIVSKRHVKMSRTRFLPEIKPYGGGKVQKTAYEFVRK